MGIYDRDYARDESPGIRLGGDRMMVTNLVLINVGVYLLQLLTNGERGNPGWLTENLSLQSDLLSHPWQCYQLLTYGFLHDVGNLQHILGNMFGLWFLGRDVEWKYGRQQFLSLYLTLIILSGLGWVVAQNAAYGQAAAIVVGASGGVVGVVLLFALNFPHRTILLFLVLPIPAWLLGVLVVGSDLLGAINQTGNVAYTCHLAGAAIAFVYYRTGWSLGRLLPRRFSLKSLKPRPKLRVHEPDEKEDKVSQQVDEILQKIQTHGQDSLTKKERQILEDASRRYQKKHR